MCAVFIGTLSDRAKGRFRRKPYVLVFAPMFALGFFLRIGAFTNESGAAVYYTGTYLLAQFGYIGVRLVADAWGQELATTTEQRSTLYSYVGFGGLINIVIVRSIFF